MRVNQQNNNILLQNAGYIEIEALFIRKTIGFCVVHDTRKSNTLCNLVNINPSNVMNKIVFVLTGGSCNIHMRICAFVCDFDD